MNSYAPTAVAAFTTPEGFVEHWQGHRRLTRRVIEAFPSESFSSFSLGGMRPFSQLALEILDMQEPGLQGLVSGVWPTYAASDPSSSRERILERWDLLTDAIDRLWPDIAPGRFLEIETAFGMYTQPVYATVFYMIDNEIHHRAQGYVYLRALGIEPPAFWER